jgi:hypothetical protein
MYVLQALLNDVFPANADLLRDGIQEAGELRVTRAVSFAERSENWLTPSNHNHLRITRIPKSLRLLGLETEAIAFFECLANIYRLESAKATPRISEETFTFWLAAARG